MSRLACGLLLFSSAALASNPDAWVFVRDEDSTSMSGSTRDLKAARSHLHELGPGYLWFRHDGKEYVVQGAAALKEIDELAEEQSELGDEQGRLGEAQGELGRQQGELGRRQARAGSDGEGAAEQSDLGRGQERLGREQARLGKEQARMGREQARLGKQMEQKIRELIESSLKDGTAKQVG